MLKALLMKFVFEKVPVLTLTKETAKRILAYCQDSYFKHMRLYEFIFNNTSPNELKRINFVTETVKTAKPLSQALMISDGRPALNMGDTGTSNMMMSDGETASIQQEMEDEEEDGMAEPPIEAMDQLTAGSKSKDGGMTEEEVDIEALDGTVRDSTMPIG